MVMVSKDTSCEVHCMIDAFARFWTVTYDVAQTIHFVAVAIFDVLKNGAQGHGVAVNIADNRTFHDNVPTQVP